MKWFDSRGVGLYSGETVITAVLVKRSMTGYRIVDQWTESPANYPDGITRILEKIPGHLPVVPVAPGGLHRLTSEQTVSPSRTIQKPDELISGNPPGLYRNDLHLTGILSPAAELLTHLNRIQPRSSGVIAPGTALTAFVRNNPLLRQKNVLIVDDHETCSHLAGFTGGKLNFFRTVRRRRDQVYPEIALAVKRMRKETPGAIPGSVVFVNAQPDARDSGIPDLPPMTLLQDQDPEFGTVIAAGAAMASLEWGDRSCLGSPAQTGGFRRVFTGMTRSILAVTAMVFLVWNINLAMRIPGARGPDRAVLPKHEQLREEISRLRKLTGSDRAVLEPGRSAGDLIRGISLAAEKNRPVIDDLSGTLHRISIRGRGKSLGTVSGFREALQSQFPDSNVSIVSTDRAESGEYRYAIMLEPAKGAGS